MSMTCRDLAARIEQLEPNAQPRDVARLCLLMANSVDDFQELDDPNRLDEARRETGIRLQAASDQHTAMTNDLEDLARDGPSELTSKQVHTLLRVIKIQGQVLQLYVGRSG